MSAAAHALAAAAAKHIDQVGAAEGASELRDQAQDRTRDEVSALRGSLRFQTEVARAAVLLVVRLAQIPDQSAVPADLRGAEVAHASHEPALRGEDLLVQSLFDRRTLQQGATEGVVAFPVEEHALGRQSIASGPAGFLHVVLDRFRLERVDHASDVAAIDSHSECHRGDHDAKPIVAKLGFDLDPFLGRQSRVICACGKPSAAKLGGKRFGVAPAEAIHDRRRAGVAGERFRHLLSWVDPRKEPIRQVGPIEVPHQHLGISKT